jgi:Rho family protein
MNYFTNSNDFLNILIFREQWTAHTCNPSVVEEKQEIRAEQEKKKKKKKKKQKLGKNETPISEQRVYRPEDFEPEKKRVLLSEPSVSIFAHKAILAASSKFFSRVFHIADKQLGVTERDFLSETALSQGHIRGILECSTNSKGITTITLSEEIYSRPFRQFIEFLYSGLSQSITKQDAPQVANLARLFENEHLLTACNNILEDNEWLNPSIGTWLNDETGAILARLFLNKPEFSDLEFLVSTSKKNAKSTKILANQAIISARCPTLAESLDAGNHEGLGSLPVSGNVNTFQEFVQYLYADHCGITPDNQVELIEIAAKFGVPRLISLCELYISKTIETATFQGIENASIDVIGLLHVANAAGADQLRAFCLHFISTNYGPMKKRAEWKTLSKADLQHIEEHKWPPQSYLDAVADYEQQMRALGNDDKCSIM